MNVRSIIKTVGKQILTYIINKNIQRNKNLLQVFIVTDWSRDHKFCVVWTGSLDFLFVCVNVCRYMLLCLCVLCARGPWERLWEQWQECDPHTRCRGPRNPLRPDSGPWLRPTAGPALAATNTCTVKCT